MCVLLVFYIILAIPGIYNIGTTIILPFVVIPLTLYLIKNTLGYKTHILYHVATLLAIYALTASIESCLIYITGIIVPAYAVAYFYKKKYPLPNTIMYAGIISGVACLIYQGLMKWLGMNYELEYILLIEELKNALLPIVTAQLTATSKVVDKGLEVQLVQMFIGNLDLIKQLFASMIIIHTFICTIIQVLITHIILRRKDKELPKFGQLLDFKISRLLLVVLAGAILLVATATDSLSSTMILGMNVVVIMYMLFMLLGLLSVIGIIKKSSINKGLKIISSIFLGVLIIVSPTLLILFGFLDTVFNFRKVTIVV
ncbi:DUF2232 domain-containing protein [Cellulosilyticum ruminicola]|uniref:DUF2232 domain-containing protein n=1 Tax=Cellulosilyticum ruminicola TaxID=425254 RepID=UPI0006D1DE9D|nr:DUF2232 domain-containing protein [Cellulosilyticum ruminicola]